jgi:hypothetical protein
MIDEPQQHQQQQQSQQQQYQYQQQQQQQQHFCAMCNKKFVRADLLRKHQKSHASSVCNVCGQVLSDKFALTKHQIEVSLFFIQFSKVIQMYTIAVKRLKVPRHFVIFTQVQKGQYQFLCLQKKIE